MATNLGVNATPASDLMTGVFADSSICISGVWMDIEEVFICISGVWQSLDEVKICIASAWDDVI